MFLLFVFFLIVKYYQFNFLVVTSVYLVVSISTITGTFLGL